ncbi:hypothetical protein RHSIM_Rhsim10G0107500 [Rhododendron simsii]|uniref:Exostosin GT47 domain-containing protein n=1 Tax=Rhododendron simsii TaxID=118357 RepID=A0A834LE07_RHOSS|nr:hypothetical protein RHSIM_Rhsim10G0107500 [Rhododendron simsii]
MMSQPSTELEGLEEHTKSPKIKSTITSSLSRLTPVHRTLLFAVILFQVFVVLYFTRTRNVSISKSPDQPLPADVEDAECDSRWIYVYDLPSMYNSDLKDKCEQLDPWQNKCEKNLNDGFGQEAMELSGIVPESILPAWYWTDQFWGEVMFHNRMLNYECRTLEPENATAFYIPFYAGFAVGKYSWGNHTTRERDWHAEMLSKWIQEQKWWKRFSGSNHFIMLGRVTWDFRRSGNADAEWGSSFLNMPAMQKVVRMSIERNIWDNLDIAVPYPTIFHPRFESDIVEWQRFIRSRRRNYLFTFVGGARKSFKNDFRGILQSQCLNESTTCRNVDCSREKCSDGATSIMETFLDSDFCLQPRGDTFTRRSVFDCMLAGSIPVFFWRRTAYLQYQWFVPDEPESYSVFIHRDDVRNGTNIRRVLEAYGREEVERMREKIIEYIPKFVYAKPSKGLEKIRDAFDVAVDGILSKIQDAIGEGDDWNWMNEYE